MIEDLNRIYIPISCVRYTEIELAIMRQRRLRLTWREDNIFYNQIVMPVDLETLCGEEFLHIRTVTGTIVRIRLDRLQRMQPV